jgi:hypothetical protein
MKKKRTIKKHVKLGSEKHPVVIAEVPPSEVAEVVIEAADNPVVVVAVDKLTWFEKIQHYLSEKM